MYLYRTWVDVPVVSICTGFGGYIYTCTMCVQYVARYISFMICLYFLRTLIVYICHCIVVFLQALDMCIRVMVWLCLYRTTWL